MSSETLPGADGRADAVGTGGIVVLAHGGAAASKLPTSPVQASVLRMIPVAAAIREAVSGSGIEVRRARFRLRGWNGAAASPVRDLTELLDQIAAESGSVPVVLVGHSMGARAALRAAGHPLVTAVAGLAPWVPPGEPVDQLAGRRILLVHASTDRICSPAETWAYGGTSPGRRAGGDDRDGPWRSWHAAPGAPLACRRGRVRPGITGAGS